MQTLESWLLENEKCEEIFIKAKDLHVIGTCGDCKWWTKGISKAENQLAGFVMLQCEHHEDNQSFNPSHGCIHFERKMTKPMTDGEIEKLSKNPNINMVSQGTFEKLLTTINHLRESGELVGKLVNKKDIDIEYLKQERDALLEEIKKLKLKIN